MIFLILFFNGFWRFKKCFGVFFTFFAKFWPKNMYRSSKSRSFLFDLFHLVTLDDLDLYYGLKAQEMILTDVSDTIHADSLTLLCSKHINFTRRCHQAREVENSDFDLTCDVISDLRVNFFTLYGSSRTGLSNGVWNLEIGLVVWEISGGGALGPRRTCY